MKGGLSVAVALVVLRSAGAARVLQQTLGSPSTPASQVHFIPVPVVAEQQLLQFLAAKEMPPYHDFLPACLAHMKKVVTSVDNSYTDIQLEQVLEDQCWLDHKNLHPNKDDWDGFDDHHFCKDFSTKVVDARHAELETGKKSAYEDLCKDFYVHKGGKLETAKKLEVDVEAVVEKVEKEVKKEEKTVEEELKVKSNVPNPSGRVWKIVVVLLALLIVVALGFLVASKRRQPRQ